MNETNEVYCPCGDSFKEDSLCGICVSLQMINTFQETRIELTKRIEKIISDIEAEHKDFYSSSNSYYNMKKKLQDLVKEVSKND